MKFRFAIKILYCFIAITFLITCIIIRIMARRLFEGQLYDQFESKIYFNLTRAKTDYALVRNLLDKVQDKSMVKSIINNFLPPKGDILDYGDRDLRFFHDIVISNDIPYEYTIIGWKDQVKIEYNDEHERQENKRKQQIERVNNSKNFSEKIENFVISDWLNIKPFIENLRRMRKGEQHRMCNYAKQYLKDKWDSTYKHNTNKEFKSLMSIYKFLNITNSMQPDYKMKYGKSQMAGKQQLSNDQLLNKLIRNFCKIYNLNPEQGPDIMLEAQIQENLATLMMNQDLRLLDEDEWRQMIFYSSLIIQMHSEVLPELAPQMFKSFTRIPDSINNIHDILENQKKISENMAKTSENVDEVCTAVTDTMLKINTMISNIVNKIEGACELLPLLLTISKIIALIYILSQTKEYNTPYVISLLILILPNDVIGNLAKLVPNLNRAVQGIMNKFMQWRPQADGDDDCSIIEAFFDLTKMLFSGLFKNIDGDAYKRMHLKNNKVKLLSDFLKSFTTITDYACALFEKILSFMGDMIIKHYGVIPSFLKEDNILDTLVEKYLDYYNRGYFKTAVSDANQAQMLMQLCNQLIEQENKLNRKVGKYSSMEKCRIFPYLRVMIRSLEKVIQIIPPHVKGEMHARRDIPPWLYGHGKKTRIGKSTLLQNLIVNEVARVLGIRDHYCDPSDYSYFRNIGDEYWEGYHNQPIVQANDIFQNCGDEQKMNDAILELTNIVDDAPYPLNMAFESKGQAYFTSQVFVTNAQSDIIGRDFISAKCLSGGTHIYARRTAVYELDVNPNYYRNGRLLIPVIETVMSRNCKVSRYVPTIPADMYTLTFTNPVTGAFMKTVSLDDGVDYILQLVVKHTKTVHKFKEDLLNCLKENWNPNNQNVWKPQMDIPKDITNENTTQNANLQECDCLTHNQGSYHECNEKDCGWICDGAWKVNRSRIYVVDDGEQQTLSRPTNILPYETMTTSWNKNDYERFPVGGTLFNDVYLDPAPQEFKEEWYDARCSCLSIIKKYMYDKYKQDFNIKTEEFKQYVKAYIKERHEMIHQELCTNKNGNFVYGYCLEEDYRVLDNIYANVLQGFMLASPNFGWHYNIYDRLKREISSFINLSKNLIKCIFWVVVLFEIVTLIFGLLRSIFKPKKFQGSVESHEGNNKVAKTRYRRTRKVPTKLHGHAQMYDQQNVDIESIIKNAFVTVNLHIIDDNQIEHDNNLYMRLFCVGGSVFVMPKHYWHHLSELQNIYREHYPKYTCVLKLTWASGKTTNIPFDTIELFEPNTIHSEDILFMRVRGLTAARDLKQFFIRDEDDPNLVGAYLYGIRSKRCSNLVNKDEPVLFTVGGVTMSGGIYRSEIDKEPLHGEFDIPSREYVVPFGYVYTESFTLAGDCGMLLLHVDGKTGCRRILGMHTAASIKNEGMSSPIYQEDIEDAYEYFNSLSDNVVYRSDCKFMTAQCDTSCKLYDGIANQAKLDVIGSTGYLNNKRIRSVIPRKSKIVPSLVAEDMEIDFGPNKFAPAALAPFKNEEGETVSPLINALKKMSKYSPMVPQYEYDEIVNHIYESIESWKGPMLKYPRVVLSDEETINGIFGMNPLDMSTSAGFPYNNEINGQGKLPWFECYEVNGLRKYKMSEKLLYDVRVREDYARQGIIQETYFIGTLKDETRPIDKVKLGKTRLFQVGPMDLSILIRKYFGVFIAHCHTTPITGEMAIGLNPNSEEWTRLVQYFREVGDQIDDILFADGDFAEYDASLFHQIACVVADVVNLFYNDGPENARIRKVLLETCVNTRQIFDILVILFMQGNPSGIVLTTILNCIANMFFIRLAFRRLTKLDISLFHKYIRAKFMGDDNLLSIAQKKISNEINMLTLEKFYATVGLKYTSATKTDIVAPFHKINEISFLKRSFVKHSRYNLWLAPLDHDVIMEIARWSEGDPYDMKDQMNRFNSTLLELANYGLSEFTQVRRVFVKYCNKLRDDGYVIKPTDLFSYDYVFSLMFPDYSLANKHRIDLPTLSGDTSVGVQCVGPDCDVGKLVTYTFGIGDAHPNGEFQCIAQTQSDKQIKIEMDSDDDEIEIMTEEEIKFIKRRCTQVITYCIRGSKPCFRRVRHELNDMFMQYINRRKFNQILELITSIWKEILKQEFEEQIDETVDMVKDEFVGVTQMYKQVETCHINDSDYELCDSDSSINIDWSKNKVMRRVNKRNNFEMDYDAWAKHWLSNKSIEYLKQIKNEMPAQITAMNVNSKHQQIIQWMSNLQLSFDIRKFLAIKRNINEAFQEKLNKNVEPNLFRKKLKDFMDTLATEEKTKMLSLLVSDFEGKTQSDNKENMNQTFITQKVSTFADQSEEQKDKIPAPHHPTINATQPIDLDMILKRPFPVNQTKWLASDAMGSNIIGFNVNLELISNAFLREKIKGVQLYAPDIEVSIRINSTPMHYGRLLCAIYPCDSVLADNYKKFENASTFEWHQVICNKQQTVTFTVPYRSFQDRTALSNTTSESFQGGFVIRFWVAVPLSMTSGTASPVTVTTFARYVNLNMAGYCFRGIAQGDTVDKEEQIKSKQEQVISTSVSALGDFVSKCHYLPVIGGYAAPVGKALHSSAELLRKHGYSTPVNLKASEKICIGSFKALQTDDLVNSHKLTYSQEAAAAKDFRLVHGFEGETSYSHFMSRPFLCYTGRIQSTDVYGGNLYQTFLNPRAFWYRGYHKTYGNTELYEGPMGFLARYHQMWRGGMRFHISFDATPFHSVRVRFFWDPTQYSDTDPNPNPSPDTTANYLNITMDINEATDYSLTIPYQQDRAWQACDTVLNFDKLRYNNGQIGMQLITTLTSSEAVVNPIYFQIFVSPAEDFQMALPTTFGMKQRGYFSGVSQMDGGYVLKDEIPASSYLTLQKMNYPVLGGVTHGFKLERRNTSYEFNDIKQLCNMLSWCGRIAGNKDILFNTGAPLSFTTGDPGANPSMMYNFLQNMEQVFLFNRGMYRLVLYPSFTEYTYKEGATFEYSGFSVVSLLETEIGGVGTTGNILSQDPTVATNFFALTDQETICFTEGLFITNDCYKAPLDVQIPFYELYNCRHVRWQNSTTTWNTHNIIRNCVSSYPAATQVWVAMLSGGDDYIMGCQIGIPKSRYDLPSQSLVAPVDALEQGQPTTVDETAVDGRRLRNKRETSLTIDDILESSDEEKEKEKQKKKGWFAGLTQMDRKKKRGEMQRCSGDTKIIHYKPKLQLKKEPKYLKQMWYTAPNYYRPGNNLRDFTSVKIPKELSRWKNEQNVEYVMINVQNVHKSIHWKKILILANQALKENK